MQKISVVIPLYNKELSVTRAVTSVLYQTYENFELIVIDDGSTDSSATTVSRIKDVRLKVVQQVNRGVSAARNNGVLISKSDYICFLDADDEWEPNFLEEIVKLIALNPNASLYSTRFREVDENSNAFLGTLSLTNDFFGDCQNFFRVYQKSYSLICSSCVCINRNIFTKIGGFPEGVRVGEDIYVWLRMALHAPALFSARVCSTIYRNAENRTHQRIIFEPQYNITFFLTNDFWINDPFGNIYKKDIYSLLLKNTVVISAYFAEKGNRDALWFYFRLVNKFSFIYSLILLGLAVTPKSFISISKKIRDIKTRIAL